MASPAENADLLERYWDISYKERDATTMINSGFKAEPLYRACVAMRELVQQCAYNPEVRALVFAKRPIFSTALLAEPYGYTDKTIAAVKKGQGVYFAAGKAMLNEFGYRPPRQIMLDAIYERALGGFFRPQDPAGIVSWLQSALVAGAGIQFAIAADANPQVRAAALKIVGGLAYPTLWLDLLIGAKPSLPGASRGTDGAIFKLKDYLPESPWDAGTRITLNALATKAEGRAMEMIAIEATLAAQNAQPVFPTGDGSMTKTTPPPGKPLYLRGDLISCACIGLWAGTKAFELRRSK